MSAHLICKRWLPSLNLFSVFVIYIYLAYIGDCVLAMAFVTVIFVSVE